MTRHLVIEQDAFMRMFVPMLDPTAPKEYLDAVADFFAHDVPDFDDWLNGVRAAIPALYPTRVSLADNQAHFQSLLADADACIIESLAFGPEELRRSPRLRVVQKYGAITRNIDTIACVRNDIAVSTQRRRVNVSLAELAFALIAAFAKHVIEFNHVIDEERLRAAGYTLRPYDHRYTGGSNFARIPGLRMMQGKCLGIIGFGEVGRELARRARAFEMRVIYFQRTPLSALEEGAHEAEFVPLQDLLAQSDYVSVHLPTTPQTIGLLGPAAFSIMKPGSFLINVARPELVDRTSLFAALQSGRLAGYGTDVWFQRPAQSSDPVFDYPNIIALPHIAIANRRYALADIAEMFLKMANALSARSTRSTQ